ncbi:MAG: FecR domain-containing protein [Psychroflexus maritimus]
MEEEKMLHKYLNNELKGAELDSFLASDVYQEYKALITHAKAFKSLDYNTNSSYTNLQQEINKKKIKRGKLVSLSIIGAIAALLVIGVFVLADLFTHTENFHTGIAEKSEFDLPDQSQVFLAPNSNLLLANKTWLNNRSLKLIGEASFNVKKGKVFVVNTRMGNVSVLGTEFNVKHREKLFEVKCFSGKVQVDTGGKSFILEAGERLQNFDGNVNKSKTSVKSADWRKNFSTFNTVAVGQVIRELKNYYAIEINYSSINKDLKFSGSFEHDNLENALKSICQPLSLEFEILENKAIIYNK